VSQSAHDVTDILLLCAATQLHGGLAAAWADAYPTDRQPPAVACALTVTPCAQRLCVTLTVTKPPPPLGGFPSFFEVRRFDRLEPAGYG
jgi:hypothetical protein